MKDIKEYDLFFGCLGNGVTVCNRAEREYGDYKKVAHISEYDGGTIQFQTERGERLPLEVVEEILEHAKIWKKEREALHSGRAIPLSEWEPNFGFTIDN